MADIKRVVVLGGGHGSSVILAGLKDREVALSAVLSMADDGGSTGRLRKELGVSALGDIRNCLAAASDSADLSDLFSYRFAEGELEGHSLGNLFLAAGELMAGDIQKSIDFAREALGVATNIYPSTLDNSQLTYAANGIEAVGMHKIAKLQLKPQPNLFLDPKAALSTQAKTAIKDADLIVIAPGNFYCSIAQVLLVSGMAQALKESSARVIMVTNLLNIDRHNAGFSPVDYMNEVERLLGCDVIDTVVYNQEIISQNNLKTGESQVAAEFDHERVGDKLFIAGNLLDKRPVSSTPNDKIAYIRSSVRHDEAKLAGIICGF